MARPIVICFHQQIPRHLILCRQIDELQSTDSGRGEGVEVYIFFFHVLETNERLIIVIMNPKLVIGVLASIVALFTYIISTIIASVQLNYGDWDKIKVAALYFTSSYVTFILFIGFLTVVILAALKYLKNYLLIIILTFFDGAVMVTAGASLCTSVYIAYVKGAGVGMFIGVAVLLLVKIFPILPLTIELLTKGISVNTGNDSMLQKYLPFAIYGALIFGYIASLVYTGFALAVTMKWYAQIDNGTQFYSPANKFQYSLPLFIFLQMMLAMVLFVQFKWKWGVHAFAVLSSFLLVILGYALNIMALQLYYNDAYDNDFNKVLHGGNISMTVASVFMILITIFVNMAWPVLYNLRNPTGDEETNMAGPVLCNLRNPTTDEDTEQLLN